jgi:hypothetical protein
VKPRVFSAPPDCKVLDTVPVLPSPDDVEASLPEVISLVYETPNVDQGVGFGHFARGVACTALIVPREQHRGVHDALLEVATRLADSGELPALSLEFQDELREAELVIFRNGEPLSFHSQLAFMQGAFWLLGFIKDPRKRRKGGLSPVQWVARMQAYWASRGVLPQ